jgi:hypothetical protein
VLQQLTSQQFAIGVGAAGSINTNNLIRLCSGDASHVKNLSNFMDIVGMIKNICPYSPPPTGGVDVMFVVSAEFTLQAIENTVWQNAFAIAKNIQPAGGARIGIIYYAGDNQPNQFTSKVLLALDSGNPTSASTVFSGVITGQQWLDWLGVQDVNTGLTLAQQQFNTYPSQAKKYVVLVGSGNWQHPSTPSQCCNDPFNTAVSLRTNTGVTILGYGAGSVPANINTSELELLTGSTANVYTNNNFMDIAKRITNKM